MTFINLLFETKYLCFWSRRLINYSLFSQIHLQNLCPPPASASEIPSADQHLPCNDWPYLHKIKFIPEELKHITGFLHAWNIGHFGSWWGGCRRFQITGAGKGFYLLSCFVGRLCGFRCFEKGFWSFNLELIDIHLIAILYLLH